MTSEPEQRGGRRAILVMGCITTFAFALSAQMLPAMLGPVAESFEFDFAERGMLLGAMPLGYVISALFAGPLADRIGRRPIVVIGLVLGALGLFLAASARHVIQLQSGIFLIGLSGGVTAAPLNALVSDVYATWRGPALNIMQSFFNVGAVIGPAMVSVVFAARLSWRYGFGTGAATLVISLLMTLWALRRAGSHEHAARARSDERVPWPLVGVLACALGLYVGGELTFAYWSPNYLEETFGMPPDRAATVLSGFWLAMMAGRALYVWLIPRLGYLAPLLTSALLAALAGAGLTVAPTGRVAWALCCLVGFFLGGTWPTIMGYAGHRIRGKTGTVFGLIVATGAVGSLIFPPTAGALAEALDHGLRTVMAVGTCILVFEGLIILALRLRYGPE